MTDKTDHCAHLSNLASGLQGHARAISYDDGPLKALLQSSSHALDTEAVRVHGKTDGLLLINARGKARYMTFRERLAYRLLGKRTEIRP